MLIAVAAIATFAMLTFLLEKKEPKKPVLVAGASFLFSIGGLQGLTLSCGGGCFF